MGRKRLLIGLLERKLGKPRLKFVTILIVLPQVSQKVTSAQLAKSSMKTEDYHFGEGWQVRFPVRKRPMNSKGG
jgi:hypothetical protein